MTERDEIRSHCSTSDGHEEATLTLLGLSHKKSDQEFKGKTFSETRSFEITNYSRKSWSLNGPTSIQ